MNKTTTRKHVYLLIGPRGAGKSYYAKHLLVNQPELLLISRDEILVREFGSTHMDPYTGAHSYAIEAMHRQLCSVLQTHSEVKIILDCWTEDSRGRALLIRKLQQYGATRVVALYFVTPREIVNSWFWRKPGIAKIEDTRTRRGENLVYFSAGAPLQDYDAFHRFAKHINSDGFDEIIRIDPQAELIILD